MGNVCGGWNLDVGTSGWGRGFPTWSVRSVRFVLWEGYYKYSEHNEFQSLIIG